MGCGENPNPLDSCGRSQFQCDNPCNKPPGGCDLLPTQLDAFTTQFFGNQLGKIVSGDSIAWQLPCGLDVGTAANPRLPGESLACYFLRLFEAGVTGIIGTQGAQGLPGACGQDAFTVTLQNFTQPTPQDPYVAVTTRPGFSLVPGLPVEIQGSGYYIVQDAESDGATLLQLTQPFVGAPAVIPAGSIVIASGLPGAIIKGPRGLQGPAGIQGPQGAQGPPAASATQGPPGPTIHLPSNIAGFSPLVADPQHGFPPVPNPTTLQVLTNSYAVIGTNPSNTLTFTTPDASLATYYVLFRVFSSLSNLNPAPSTTGTNSFKVTGPSGDVDGTNRSLIWVSDTRANTGEWSIIPVILVNNTGAVASWTVFGKSNISGFQIQATAFLGWCGLSWFKF